MSRRFAFPPSIRIFEAVREVRRQCVTCQSSEPPNWSAESPIENTPIPAHIMSHVAVDIFSLPLTKWAGNSYDALVVCVDRLSG